MLCNQLVRITMLLLLIVIMANGLELDHRIGCLIEQKNKSLNDLYFGQCLLIKRSPYWTTLVILDFVLKTTPSPPEKSFANFFHRS